MKKLNRQGTRIFCSLLNKLGDQAYKQIVLEDFLPLTIELIAEHIRTPYGIAKLYSLMHHFVQNGDLMRDPEMTFLVVDARQQPKDYQMIAIFPQSYQLDSLGIYEEGIQLTNGETTGYLFTYQAAHCGFANIWLQNIKAQGSIE